MNRTPQRLRPAQTRPNPRHAAARRRLAFRPLLESIERRQLLAGGFLQGTVFLDTDASGKLEPGNTPLGGALVQLVDPISHNVLQSFTTQADGNYLFTGLAPGTYQLVETPPSGYANEGIQNNSPLTPVLSSTSSTINVQVVDPSQLTVSFSSPDEYARKPGAVQLQASADGGATYTPEAFSIGQLPITVSGPGGLVTSEFSSYCADVFAGLSFSPDSFGVTGLPAPPAVNGAGNAGRIGYLYEQFGSVLSQVGESDAQALQQQALQLAIWKLEYDSVPNNFTVADFNSGNIEDVSLVNAGGITNYALSDLLGAAASFINASLGQSQPVTLLQVIPGSQVPASAGFQDLLAPGSLNFGNTVKASPAIVTTPGGPVALGLTISGTKFLDLKGDGFSADDTPQPGVTINLYLAANGTTGLQLGSGGDTFVGSTTTGADGTYSFTVSAAGTYYVTESVPGGYVQTGGGPSGSAGNAYWTVNATAGHSYSGYNF
ncbi:MAG TPA: SdrD B-like domain-containing protein, partial [Isosphaeraceae bacterium]